MEKYKRINSRSSKRNGKAASNLEFEEAARIRDEIKKLQQKELGLMAIPNTDFKISSNSKKK